MKNYKKHKIVKDAHIKELIEEPKEIKSPNWLNKNKFKEILTIIDSNKFGHKNKISDFEYIDIKDLVNNIKDNTISEIDAKKRLNTSNKIKNSEIKHKRLIFGQKELLNLLNDLSDIILTDKTLMSSKDEKEKLKEEKENDKLKEKKENENENENENEDKNEKENEDDDDIMKILIRSNEYDNEKNPNKKNKIIKKLNDHLGEIIGKPKPFEDQIKSIRKIKNLHDYYYVNDFGDKELKFKIFKLKLAHLSNIIDENLFEQIFDHKFEALANKLINTTNKEENQIIVKNIKKNKDKLFEMDEFCDFLIQPSD